MAVVAPMPVTTHTQSSFGSIRYQVHNSSRRGSDTASVPLLPPPVMIRASSSASAAAVAAPTTTHSRRPPLTTLEDIAAELHLRLSTSPSADFGYLDDSVYGGHSAPLLKSRSLPPSFNRNQVLKSNLSPKSPLRKTKSVRFADTQGLPLVAAVHQLTPKDSSYTVNKIVPYDDQEDILSGHPLIMAAPAVESAENLSSAEHNGLPKTLVPRNGSPKIANRQDANNYKPPTHKHTFMFTQPSLEPDFYERVKRDNVVLESIREEPRSLHGIVRVSNIAYSKEVTIRWTHDGWRTSHDTCCVFCSNDRDTDRFAFELPINGDDVSFAIRYRAESGEFWDSNRGVNYAVTSRL